MCGKRFHHKKYLELHMYSHSSEKKVYILRIIISDILKQYFKTYLQFECDICHRKYKSSDILRHHVRMVHKNLPVSHDTNPKSVKKKVMLKAHNACRREKK